MLIHNMPKFPKTVNILAIFSVCVSVLLFILEYAFKVSLPLFYNEKSRFTRVVLGIATCIACALILISSYKLFIMCRRVTNDPMQFRYVTVFMFGVSVAAAMSSIIRVVLDVSSNQESSDSARSPIKPTIMSIGITVIAMNLIILYMRYMSLNSLMKSTSASEIKKSLDSHTAYVHNILKFCITLPSIILASIPLLIEPSDIPKLIASGASILSSLITMIISCMFIVKNTQIKYDTIFKTK